MFIGFKSFPRSVQFDDYTCGSRAVYSVLTHFDVQCPHHALKAELGTTPERGTAVHQMIRVMRLHGMKVGYRPYLNWRAVVKALGAGAVVIVHLDGDHLGTVFAADERHVHLADPSLLRCFGRKQPRREFFRRWSNWGLVVRRSATKASRRS